jgi:hypothetical protein
MHLMPLLAYCASRHEKNEFGLVIIISVRAFVFSTFYSAIVLWKILLNLLRVLPKNNLYWTLVKGLLSEIYMHFVNACELNLCSDENEPAPSARWDLRQTGQNFIYLFIYLLCQRILSLGNLTRKMYTDNIHIDKHINMIDDKIKLLAKCPKQHVIVDCGFYNSRSFVLFGFFSSMSLSSISTSMCWDVNKMQVGNEDTRERAFEILSHDLSHQPKIEIQYFKI